MASIRDEESQEGTMQPLLEALETNEGNTSNGNNDGVGASTGVKSKRTILETAVRECGKAAVLLAKHVPTGTALFFEVFIPITTARGNCTHSTRIETLILISLCAISSAILTLTDSFTDNQNKIRYGIATCTGLFVFDLTPPPLDQKKYRINWSDFVHVLATFIIFSAVVLYNNDVVNCFFGEISDVEYVVQAFTAAPILIGFLGCVLFLVFPSKRHGLGFPLGGLSSHQ